MEKLQTHIFKARSKWKAAGAHDKAILVATLSYLVLITAFMVWHQEFFSPDRFFVLAFLMMVLLGRAWSFLWDWLPPILLILGYEYLRGLVPHLVTKVHIRTMIYFDKTIFGTVPTIALQQWLFRSGTIHWYDQAAVVLYFLHFIVPLLAAMVFWFLDKHVFKLYMAAMVLLSYLAFLTYYIFPAMPPWMAGQQGFLPPVAHIMDQVLANFAHPISLPTVYNYVGANLVAAVPSLHAAYPLMTTLFFYKKFPRYGAWAFLYPAAMWFTVVYLGEHYVFDIVVAIVYVLVIFALVTNWRGITNKAWQKLLQFFKRPVQAPVK